jgi:ribose 5-phosphate isomerase B
MQKMAIPIGSDHRGFQLKAYFVEWLDANGYAANDIGTHTAERCDALDFAKKLAEDFKANTAQFGVLICGSGQAMAMAANRHRYIRTALCMNAEAARTTREHNDANVLALGADFVSNEAALEILKVFLGTKFLGGRYAERRDRLTELGGL